MAASYPQKLCTAMAQQIAQWASKRMPAENARRSGVAVEEGHVHRHSSRGDTGDSAREVKMRQDRECNAGMRNPRAVVDRWPELRMAMARVRKSLMIIREDESSFVAFAAACGRKAPRQPPTERWKLANQFGIQDHWDRRRPASTWRPALVRAVQDLAYDPGTFLPIWLEPGAPMGLRKAIEAGGLFPAAADEVRLGLEELESAEIWTRNQPSFDATFEEGPPPGVPLMEGYVDSGFGELFVDLEDAEKHFGVPSRPSPRGTVSKQEANGSFKHRLI